MCSISVLGGFFEFMTFIFTTNCKSAFRSGQANLYYLQHAKIGILISYYYWFIDSNIYDYVLSWVLLKLCLKISFLIFLSNILSHFLNLIIKVNQFKILRKFIEISYIVFYNFCSEFFLSILDEIVSFCQLFHCDSTICSSYSKL